MEELKILVLVGGLVLSVPVCLKAFMELLVIPRANMRSEYNFVLEVAKHTDDNHVILYAEELGYKVLVNDNKLTTVQRKAILSFPDRANLIPKYLVVKNLLVVQNCAPILK